MISSARRCDGDSYPRAAGGDASLRAGRGEPEPGGGGACLEPEVLSLKALVFCILFFNPIVLVLVLPVFLDVLTGLKEYKGVPIA